jgi:hypothetical protein
LTDLEEGANDVGVMETFKVPNSDVFDDEPRAFIVVGASGRRRRRNVDVFVLESSLRKLIRNCGILLSTERQIGNILLLLWFILFGLANAALFPSCGHRHFDGSRLKLLKFLKPLNYNYCNYLFSNYFTSC